jgi:hypothetical protein
MHDESPGSVGSNVAVGWECGMAGVDADYFVILRQALSTFCAEVLNFDRDQGSEPAPGSMAATEQAAFASPETLVTAWSYASLLVESGREHITAFVKTITEPMEVIACWTCVRSMLEPCALASWLLDPDIDARARGARTLALRYQGLEQQLKFGRATNRSASEIEAYKKHIDNVEQMAISLGYSRVLNKKRERIGIGQNMPTATEVVGMMLDEEVMYRLLSAVAHGHSWAIASLGFKKIADDPRSLHVGGVPVTGMEKAAHTKGIGYLGVVAAKAWAKPLWYRCRCFGRDEARLAALLESTFDKLGITPASRFWRAPSS